MSQLIIPGGGGGGFSGNLSDLVIDVDKDWGRRSLLNLGDIVGTGQASFWEGYGKSNPSAFGIGSFGIVNEKVGVVYKHLDRSLWRLSPYPIRHFLLHGEDGNVYYQFEGGFGSRTTYELLNFGRYEVNVLEQGNLYYSSSVFSGDVDEFNFPVIKGGVHGYNGSTVSAARDRNFAIYFSINPGGVASSDQAVFQIGAGKYGSPTADTFGLITAVYSGSTLVVWFYRMTGGANGLSINLSGLENTWNTVGVIGTLDPYGRMKYSVYHAFYQQSTGKIYTGNVSSTTVSTSYLSGSKEVFLTIGRDVHNLGHSDYTGSMGFFLAAFYTDNMPLSSDPSYTSIIGRLHNYLVRREYRYS